MYVYGDSTAIRKRPSLSSSATAYAAKDEVGAIQTLAAGHGVRNQAGVILQGLEIIDEANQSGSGWEIHYFNAAVTAGGDNAAFGVSAEDMHDYHMGMVPVSASSFVTAGSVMVCSVPNIGEYIKPTTSSTIYCVPTVKSAMTATSQGISFVHSFFRDL